MKSWEGGYRGGEWAWCRFAFLLMHTVRPPALSSFYRVSLPSPAPCNSCSLYAVFCSHSKCTCQPQPAAGCFIGNVLLTPRADPQMASLTMTNHLVGSFTCPLNPIFGSIREQIKYLCCLLEVQGFISLCDCFMQRAGRACYIKYTRSQETNLGFSVKMCLTTKQGFVFKERSGVSV